MQSGQILTSKPFVMGHESLTTGATNLVDKFQNTAIIVLLNFLLQLPLLLPSICGMLQFLGSSSYPIPTTLLLAK